MIQLLRIPLAALVTLAALERGASGQFIFAGSTPEGDYLRGVGLAAWGMGLYNLETAQATSINVDTYIRWNEYLAAVTEQSRQARTWPASRQVADEEKKFYKQNRERMLTNPEHREVFNGEALNRILVELQNPNLTESVFRSERMKVPLPADIVRHIPFTLAEKGQQFSMDRLSLKGKGKWTVAFQDKQFDYREESTTRLPSTRPSSKRSMEKCRTTTIEMLETKADDLLNRLDEVYGRVNDPRYLEAKRRVKELKNVAEQLKTTKIERAIGDIDKYSGTTIYDLKVFMSSHNLRFGSGRCHEEKEMFPELYELLVAQHEKVKIPDPAAGR